jgi:hypothetical protein
LRHLIPCGSRCSLGEPNGTQSSDDRPGADDCAPEVPDRRDPLTYHHTADEHSGMRTTAGEQNGYRWPTA